ncbi:MAG: UDP-2,3-diacylglucosamine pyrophosphatase [Rhodospirillaceae bacterium]|nr:UDP-2,3-diacylglucosamine pyrophosphatase [Rhodospirillaceae bacterium]
MKPKLGILAGGGELPRRIADICVKENRPYCILAIEGQASAKELSGHAVAWCRLGAAAKAISFMKEQKVQEVVMAGPVKRPSLSAIHPDMKALQVITKAGARAFGDDGLLRAVIDVIEEEGVTVIGIDSILPNLRPEAGQLGDYGPNEAEQKDIERGVQVLAALSALDVGQAVVVQQGMVLGIEAAEGTDKLIERAGALSGPGSQGVLIKLPKCGQEERVDLPTIGPKTIDLAAKAGLAGVALKADGALVIDNEETVRRSNAAGMFIFALDIP